MNPLSFGDFHLDRRAMRCLKKMYRGWTPKKGELHEVYQILSDKGFVCLNGAGISPTGRVLYGDTCYITGRGKEYYLFTKDRNNERRWTRGLAIAAIVISLAALACSVVSLVVQWQSQ